MQEFYYSPNAIIFQQVNIYKAQQWYKNNGFDYVSYRNYVYSIILAPFMNKNTYKPYTWHAVLRKWMQHKLVSSYMRLWVDDNDNKPIQMYTNSWT